MDGRERLRPAARPGPGPIESIKHRDAILDLSTQRTRKSRLARTLTSSSAIHRFLGGKIMSLVSGRRLRGCAVPCLERCGSTREADLCCYWFGKGSEQIASGTQRRVGLLATQGIRGGCEPPSPDTGLKKHWRHLLRRIATANGFWMEPTFTFRWWGSTMELKKAVILDGADRRHQCQSDNHSGHNKNVRVDGESQDMLHGRLKKRAF